MDGTFSAREDSPLRPSLGHKISGFQEKTRFSGMGVPPRRAAACTSGERGSDGACARSRENGAPNRPIWLQLLLLRAYGTARPAILARFVAAAAAFAPLPPQKYHLGGSGRGVQHMCFFRILAHSWVRTLAPRTASPHGLLLDKKYFLPKRPCPHVVQTLKCIRRFFWNC